MCFDMVPGRVFAFFRRAAKEGRSRRSETSLVQTPVPAAAGSFPWGKLPPKVTDEGNPHHSGQSQPFSGFAARLCLSFPHPVASGGPLSLFRTKKEAKEMRQREPRRRTGEWPVSGFWPNTGKIPPAPPLQIETVRFDLRRTFRRNLQAATNGSCAVFRRIRTRLRPP